MGSIVYMLQVKLPSKNAKRMHGYGWVWRIRAKFRTRPPDSEEDLFRLFYPYVKDDLPCMLKFYRNSAVREDKGFKSCMYGHMTHRRLEIIRRGRAWSKAISTSVHKVIPTVGGNPLSWTRQPDWSRPPEEERLRLARNRFRHGPFSSRILDRKKS